jgi:uncharacterized membrane protein
VVAIILSFIPVVGWIISLILGILALILWVFLMMKAYQGTMYKLPIAGDLAEKYSKPMVDNKPADNKPTDTKPEEKK